MPILLALLLASPSACTDVRHQCRACVSRDGRERCSNIGIACQPVTRLCRPKTKATPAKPDPRAPDAGKARAQRPI